MGQIGTLYPSKAETSVLPHLVGAQLVVGARSGDDLSLFFDGEVAPLEVWINVVLQAVLLQRPIFPKTTSKMVDDGSYGYVNVSFYHQVPTSHSLVLETCLSPCHTTLPQ